MVMVIVAQTDLEVPRGQSAVLECCSEHACWHLLVCVWGYQPMGLRDVSSALCLVRMNK